MLVLSKFDDVDIAAVIEADPYREGVRLILMGPFWVAASADLRAAISRMTQLGDRR
jgi:hypothetical protein